MSLTRSPLSFPEDFSYDVFDVASEIIKIILCRRKCVQNIMSSGLRSLKQCASMHWNNNAVLRVQRRIWTLRKKDRLNFVERGISDMLLSFPFAWMRLAFVGRYTERDEMFTRL